MFGPRSECQAVAIATTTATILFTDLVGSTALLTRLGEDAFHSVRAEHDQLLRDAIERADGTVVKHGGDGLMASFPSASDAVAAACTVQQAIARRNARAAEPLGVRIGISTGDVRMEDGDYFGTPVVEAARLCNDADGGEILVAEVVRILAGTHGGHRFEPQEPRVLAGLGAPLAIASVVWDLETGGEIPLPVRLTFDAADYVGRGAEQQSLEDAWGRVAAGRTEAVFVAGEPGIGKTRLLAQFASRVHADGGVVLFGRCDEDGGRPFQPFAEALRTHASGLDDDAVTECVGTHPAEIGLVVPELSARLPEVPSSGVGDADADRDRIFEAFVGWLAVASRRRPVLLVLDDVHWASRATLLALRHLVRSEAGSTLIAATYRTTDLDRSHPLSELLADFRREPSVSRLALTGLDVDDVVDFVERRAGEELQDEGIALARVIARDTSGNPFFVGEVLRNLVESGAIERKDGRWGSEISLEELAVPEGIREVVGRRLTRLGDDANATLRAAAVIGAEFDLALLERLPNLPGDPLDALDRATEAGLRHHTCNRKSDSSCRTMLASPRASRAACTVSVGNARSGKSGRQWHATSTPSSSSDSVQHAASRCIACSSRK